MIQFVKFAWARIKWLWRHRGEPNNRAKWRRMEREFIRAEKG